MDDAATINKYMAEQMFTFRAGMATKKEGGMYDVAEKYGVMAYPTNYLVGADGKILWRAVGFDEPSLREALKAAGLK
jgi:hypothetical protein